MGEVQAANRGHIAFGVHEDNVKRAAGDGGKNGVDFHGAGNDVKFRPPPKSSDQQLTMHLIRIGDEHTGWWRERC